MTVENWVALGLGVMIVATLAVQGATHALWQASKAARKRRWPFRLRSKRGRRG